MDESWLVAAKQLPRGGRARFPHECGSGSAMMINNGPRGYSAYCHRCHAVYFVPHGPRSFKELMEARRREEELSESLQASVSLPEDFTLDIPSEGMLWLFKASITPHKARQMGIGYSATYRRVIIPIYQGDKLVYFQARALHKEQTPKYINPRVDRSTIAYWVIPPGSDTSVIVITEDILSAIRVGEFVPAMSALGTRLSVPLANQLSKYDRVITWLDPDEAGITGAASMRKLLSLTTATDNIISDADPKALTNKEIISCLKEKHISLSKDLPSSKSAYR